MTLTYLLCAVMYAVLFVLVVLGGCRLIDLATGRLSEWSALRAGRRAGGRL